MTDLELAFTAAQRAGHEVMKSFRRPQEVVEKAPGQPLTAADLAADEILRRELVEPRPEYGWLSEETVDRPDRLDAERVWVVDPIDGTRSFIRGYPEFAISIGLAEGGRAVLGVLLNPATGEIFWAEAGRGAYLARLPVRGAGGGEPVTLAELGEAPRRLEVSTRSHGEGLIIFASRSEIAAGEFEPWSGGGDAGRWRIEPVGSTAYKLARIAAGTGEVFFSRGPKSEWDICAGGLIVEEAGGRVTDLRGDVLGYNHPDPRVFGVLATNGRLHDEFLEFVASLPPAPRLEEEYRDPLHPGLEPRSNHGTQER